MIAKVTGAIVTIVVVVRGTAIVVAAIQGVGSIEPHRAAHVRAVGSGDGLDIVLVRPASVRVDELGAKEGIPYTARYAHYRVRVDFG